MMTVNRVDDMVDVYSFENFTEEDLDWKNFASVKRGMYSSNYPNFDIYIPEELAEELREKGVKVKLTEPREPGDTAKYRVNVKINMNYYDPPEVYIRHKGDEKEYLDADSLYILDKKKISYGEMMVKINHNDKSDSFNGLYVNILGVKLRENPFDKKWAEEEYPED